MSDFASREIINMPLNFVCTVVYESAIMDMVMVGDFVISDRFDI
jgi:hypothetical protein